LPPGEAEVVIVVQLRLALKRNAFGDDSENVIEVLVFLCVFASLREIRCIVFWLRVSDPRTAA